jgi:hypothetical protein
MPDKSVILYGLGPSNHSCPFDRETWGVNMAYQQIYERQGRLDKLFIGHNPNPYPVLMQTDWRDGKEINTLRVSADNWGWELIGGLVDCGVDVITLHRIQGLKSRLYPLKRLIKKFDTAYFTNTLCYMMAYAIDKKYDQIKIYGVDMLDRLEFIWEKGGLEFWIGYARGLGIDVWIAPESGLCKTRTGKPFGMDEWDELFQIGIKR